LYGTTSRGVVPQNHSSFHIIKRRRAVIDIVAAQALLNGVPIILALAYAALAILLTE
jgi:hypothetical protein